MMAAIARYFRLRSVARMMGLTVPFWWLNDRTLAELFQERVRRQAQMEFAKRSVLLDFRSYNSNRRVGKT